MHAVKECLVTPSVRGEPLKFPPRGQHYSSLCHQVPLLFAYPLPPQAHAECPGLGARSCPSGHPSSSSGHGQGSLTLRAAGRETREGDGPHRLRPQRLTLRCVRALWRQRLRPPRCCGFGGGPPPPPGPACPPARRAGLPCAEGAERSGAEHGGAGSGAAAAPGAGPGAAAAAAAAAAAGRAPAARWSGGGGRAVPGAAAVGRAHRVLRARLGPQHAGRRLLRRPQPAPPHPGGEEGAHPLQEVGGGGTCGGAGPGGAARVGTEPGGASRGVWGDAKPGTGISASGPALPAAPPLRESGERGGGTGVLGTAGAGKLVTDMAWIHPPCRYMCIYIERFMINSVSFLPSEIFFSPPPPLPPSCFAI